MYLTFQLLKECPRYSRYLPATLQITLDETRKVVDFDAIKPTNLAILFGFSDELDQYKEELTSGSGFMGEIGTMFTIMGALLVALLVLGMLYAIKPLRAKIKTFLGNYKKQMIWNGVIDIITFGYVGYCVSWWLNLTENLMNDEITPSAGNYFACLILGFIIFPYPFAMLYILMRQNNADLR